jgi:tetratricopeptide (TPR) repeat protein
LIATESYSFGMLSLAHISEFVNQLLLLSPVGMSLIVFFLLSKIRFKEFRDEVVNFLILATSFALVYLFAFNFTLGSADWDLMSMPAPFIGLLGILLFLRWGEKPSAVHRPSTSLRTSPQSAAQGRSNVEQPGPEKSSAVCSPLGKRFGAWGVIFIWFSLFHAVPWVMINAHNQRSVDRYLLIQENDPHPVDEGGYHLYKVARILTRAGLAKEVEKLYSRAIERDPYDAVAYYNLATYCQQRGDLDEALLVLESFIKIDPSHPRTDWLIGNIYRKKQDPVKALAHLEKAYPSLADNPDFLYQLGATYYSADRLERAEACALDIIKLRPEYLEAYHLLGLARVRLGHPQRARQAWEHILTVNPNDSVAIRNLKRLNQSTEK